MAGPAYQLDDPKDYDLNDIGSAASAGVSGLGIYGNLQKGGTVNDTKAAASTTTLLGKAGIFGGDTAGVETGASIANNVVGIYTGIEEGGVKGDLTAGANAGMLYANTSAALVEGGGEALAGASGVAEVAGPLAAGLAVYNFAENYQSGDTGGDTLRGAEAGAAVGSVIPVVGTVVGAVIGGAIGAISSMFGPGKQDPESANWDKYAQVYAQKGASGVSGASPSQNFQLLAGIFDSRGGGANSIPFYAKYGRMGEASFTNDMTTQINQALAKGTISQNTPPSQIYSSVVLPWINSMEPGKNLNQAGKTADGVPTAGAIQNMLTSMIGQYQAGQLTSTTKLGVSGQQIPQLQKFGAMGQPPNTQAIQATVQQHTDGFNSSIMGSPFAGGAKSAIQPAAAGGTTGTGTSASPAAASTSPSAALAGMALLMPSLFSGAKTMAAPTNNTMTGTGGASVAPQATTGGDPANGAAGTGVANTNAGTGADASSILGDVGSFLGANAGGIAEAGIVGGLGISEANSQKSENDALASSLAKPGQPYTAAGQGILGQIEGGPSVGGALGASITQQTSAATALGNIANEYATGTTTPAQDQQLTDYASQQKAMVDSQLAASGNLDSSARQAAYQQIDNNVATMKQNLIAGNTQMASAALTSVQTTYSTLLNQALSSSEFGFSTEEAAVQLQVQSDTQLAGQLQQLFSGIAQGFGNSAKNGGSAAGSAAGGAIGKAVGSAASSVAKGVSGGGGGGVASSAAGGGTGEQTGDSNLDAAVDQSSSDVSQQIDASDPFGGQDDVSSFFDQSSSDIGSYDFGGDPYDDGG